MLYLKCLGIFFLVYSLVDLLRCLIILPDKDCSDCKKFITLIVGFFLGGLWLFLLGKLIGNI